MVAPGSESVVERGAWADCWPSALAVLLADQAVTTSTGGAACPSGSKVFHTLFLAILVPGTGAVTARRIPWVFGHRALATLPALWLEDCSGQHAGVLGGIAGSAVGDGFLSGVVGIQLVGISKDMFDASIPSLLRARHGPVWLRWQLLGLVWPGATTGAGWVAQTVFRIGLLTACYIQTDPAAKSTGSSGPRVESLSESCHRGCTGALMLFFSVVRLLPTHLILWWFFPACAIVPTNRVKGVRSAGRRLLTTSNQAVSRAGR